LHAALAADPTGGVPWRAAQATWTAALAGGADIVGVGVGNGVGTGVGVGNGVGVGVGAGVGGPPIGGTGVVGRG